MATPNPVLCTDAASFQHPELLGLDGETLETQEWLTVFCDAVQARRYVREAPCNLQVWVAGSEQMEGINLAAAIKRDRDDADVSLVSFSGGGSLLSRARAAGIDEVLGKEEFLQRYSACKHRQSTSGFFVPRSAAAAACNSQVGFEANAASGFASSQRIDLPLPDPVSFAGSCAGPAQTPGRPRAGVGIPLCERDAVSGAPASSSPSGQGRTTKGYVFTIVGAGGGTGKSTVSALCACCAQEAGRKTVVVDADLQFGDLAFLLGCSSPLRIDEVAQAPTRLEGAFREGRLPVVVAAPSRLERSEVAAARFPQVLEYLRQRFDVVVVNTGPSWSDIHLHLLEVSNAALFLVDQRPSSLRACRHALDLCARCGIASQPFLFAVNRCSRRALFSSMDVSCALQGVRVHELLDGGRAVEELLGTGQPLELIDSGNPLAQSVSALLSDVLPRTAEEAGEVALPKRRKRLFGFRRGSGS